jgi:hypothetical protein
MHITDVVVRTLGFSGACPAIAKHRSTTCTASASCQRRAQEESRLRAEDESPCAGCILFPQESWRDWSFRWNDLDTLAPARPDPRHFGAPIVVPPAPPCFAPRGTNSRRHRKDSEGDPPPPGQNLHGHKRGLGSSSQGSNPTRING